MYKSIMSTNKKLIVISRYNEDISWINDVFADVIIYNKGSEWPWKDVPKVDLQNVGYEAETFLRGILEHYEILENYETIIFAQGNPFDHAPNALEKISKSDKYTFDGLSDVCNVLEIPKDENFYTNGYHNLSIRQFLVPESKITWPYNFEYKCHENKQDAARDFITINFLCKIMDIKIKGDHIKWYASAQHIVPTEFILNKSKEWWNDVYKILQISMKDYDKGHGAACDFERYWWTLFNHTPE